MKFVVGYKMYHFPKIVLRGNSHKNRLRTHAMTTFIIQMIKLPQSYHLVTFQGKIDTCIKTVRIWMICYIRYIILKDGRNFLIEEIKLDIPRISYTTNRQISRKILLQPKQHFHNTYVPYTALLTALTTTLSTALSVVLCTALSLKYSKLTYHKKSVKPT